MKPILALLFCVSVFLAPVSATAADGSGGGLLKKGFGCKVEQGKLVCGKDIKNHGNKNDDDDDDGEKPKKSKSKSKKDTGLTECTIQGPNSGGGCKTGFKRVCEKLKSGKKCCGCVADANAKPAEQEPAEPEPVEEKPAEQKPAAQEFCCTGTYAAGNKHTTCGGSEANARGNAEAIKVNGEGPVSISCAPER